MPIDLIALKSLLRRPEYAGVPATPENPGTPPLSDADAAALASVPVKVPHGYRITFASIGALLGGLRATTFRAGLKAAIAGPDAQLAATADYLLALLDGPGFDPANPDVPGFAAGFVAGGLCTPAEADTILYASVAYPAGGVVAAAAIAEARRQIGLEATAEARRAALRGYYNAEVAKVEAWEAGGYAGELAAAGAFTEGGA